MFISKQILVYTIALSCSNSNIYSEAFSVTTTTSTAAASAAAATSTITTKTIGIPFPLASSASLNRIRRTRLHEENNSNNSNNSNNNSGHGGNSSNSRDRKTDPNQDVDNLFATYMAQRKDKGFMDQSYNLGNGSANVNANTNNGNNNGNGNGNGNGNNADLNVDMNVDMNMNMNEDENQRRRLASMSIPGVKRLWGSNSSNDGKKGIVQHIPLTGPGPEPEPESSPTSGQKESTADNDNNDNDTKVTTSTSSQPEQSSGSSSRSSTKPPNPPSLLEQDIRRINTTYDEFQTQIQNQLNEIQKQQESEQFSQVNNNNNNSQGTEVGVGGSVSSPSNSNGDNSSSSSSSIQNVKNMFNQIIEEQKMHEMVEVKQQRALESFDEYEKRMKKLMEERVWEVTEGRNLNDSNNNNGNASGNANANISVNTNAAFGAVDNSNSNNPDQRPPQDPIVQEIVEEATKERRLRDLQEEQLRQYQEYEASMKKKILQNTNINVNSSTTAGAGTTGTAGTAGGEVSSTTKGGNFDQVQLDILQDLLQKRQERSLRSDVDDEDLYTTDNIEDGIDELQNKILKEEVDGGSKKKYTPESLKEWQMYRAIATKLANSKSDIGDNDSNYDMPSKSGGITSLNEEELNKILLGGADGGGITEEDSDIVEQKIEAWKEFQRKEEEMRKKSGLAIKYRPPFEWSDKPSPANDDDGRLTSSEQQKSVKNRRTFDREKAEEARSELDALALQVMNNLMNKTADSERREKIRNDIESLKLGIKARQEAMKNDKFVFERKKVVKPIDINSALGRRSEATSSRKKENERKVSIMSNESPAFAGQDMDVDGQSARNIIQTDDEEDDGEYFIDSGSNDDEESRPDSQFFRDIEEDLELDTAKNKYGSTSVSQDELDDDEGVNINLGTMEEQKFRSMVARSGVRTKEEQSKLKQEWEQFQRAEQMMRDKTGLSGKTDSSTGAQSTIETKYDVNSIFKDGDIDADLILGTLGKRPTRKKRDKKSSVAEPKAEQGTPVKAAESQLQTIEKTIVKESDDNIAEKKPPIDQNKDGLNTVIKESSSSSSSKMAEKGASPQERGSLTFGQEFDPQKQFLSNAFSSFDAKKADLLEYSVLSVAQLNTLMGLKRSVYSTGVSPYLARVNKPFQEFAAIFMLEGALVDTTGLQFEAWKRTARTYDFTIPTIEDAKYASVHSEAYAVQKIFYWTDDIFALRKVVETFEEKRLEVFQEWIESKKISPNVEVSSSPQLRSNDSELGNDIEMDVVNIQLSAWKKAAQDHGLEPPTLDLVNIVGSLNPDEAVRAVFRWTNDFMMSNNIAASYRKHLKEETSKWMEQKTESSLTVENNQKSPDSLKQEEQKVVISTSTPTMEDYLELKLRAWESVAQKHNFNAPNSNQVNVAEFAGPEKAVSSIFKWTEVEEECKEVISSYRSALQVLTQEWMEKIDKQSIESLSSSLTGEETESIPLLIPRTGVEHWLSSIADVFVPSIVISNMNKELMSSILDETGLSKYFSDDRRISASDKYDTDSQKMLGAALRAERRPDHCVIFSATPQSATQAHDLDMKNIAIVSPYPYYELTTADMTVRDFKSIGMMNLKNVFSETPSEEPMQQVQVESPRIRRETMLKTRFWDDG